jgi:hypothetical protein
VRVRAFEPHLSKKASKTFNSWDSLMVTHLTTSQPVCCLNRAERTGSLVFNILWSNVLIMEKQTVSIPIYECSSTAGTRSVSHRVLLLCTHISRQSPSNTNCACPCNIISVLKLPLLITHSHVFYTRFPILFYIIPSTTSLTQSNCTALTPLAHAFPVYTNSLNTTASTFLPKSTLLGWIATV